MSAGQIPSSDIMEAIMRDPVKKTLILQLLNQEKDNFEAYRRQERKQAKKETSLKNLRKVHCESPTALQRRKALERVQDATTSGDSSSEQSEVSIQFTGPKLPFDKLLEGVNAYVEVRRNNVDRSEGIKAVMKLMGANIKNEFTRDVTHVIFKDGTFTTYQKAKLMNVHLVSVLWLDAVRRCNARVSEKKYPAFGSQVCDDKNVSILCSQLQKDYEDIIKDEKHRSKVIDKNRRHTLMSSQGFISNNLTNEKASRSLFCDEDYEVGTILTEKTSKSPELTSDDSDCGVIDGHTSKRSEKLDLLELDLSIRDRTKSVIEQDDKHSSFLESSNSRSLLSRDNTRAKKKTFNIISDVILTSNVESNRVLQDSNVQSTMSSLRISSESDRTKSGLDRELEEMKHSKSGHPKMEVHKRISESKSLCLGSPLPKNKENRTTSLSCLSNSFNQHLELFTKTHRNKSDIDLDKSLETKSIGNRRKTKHLMSSPVSGRTNKKSSFDEKINKQNSDGNDSYENQLTSSRSKDQLMCLESEDGLISESESSQIRTTEKRSNITHRKSRKSANRSNVKLKTDEEIHFQDESVDAISKSNRKKGSRRTKKFNENQSISEETSETTSEETGEGRKTKSRGNEIFEKEISFRNSKVKKNKSLPECHDNNEITSSVTLSGLEIEDKDTQPADETDPSPIKRSRLENPTPKKTRKLYNPGNVVLFPHQEDTEEEENIRRKAKKSPDEVLQPYNSYVLLEKFKSDQKDVTGTSQSDEGSRQELDTKKTPTKSRREQSELNMKSLLNLLSEKTDEKPKRRSVRLSLSQSKPKYRYTLSESQTTLPITPMKRRSTLDFQPATVQSQRKQRLVSKKSSSIVCTKMHRYESENFIKIVDTLGLFFVENQVSDRTTHLVAGEAKRTINMLRALARGCWILKHEWLIRSKAEGRWLQEEDYEVTEFSPAVQKCRLQRQAFGPKYRMDVFKECGTVYIAKSTTPKQEDLKELITTCQGKVTNICRNATIVIGEVIIGEKLTCVTEMWVLDSITFNKLKPFKNYILKPDYSNSPCY